MFAFVFPGQGSQSIGMGKFFYDQFPASKRVFEEASDALNQNMVALVFEGTESELTLTHHAQPAIMMASLAMVAALEAETGKKIFELSTVMAGHSLGEYTALAAARVWSWHDAFQIVKKRGQAMQEAVPVGEGSMAAILGITLEDLEKILVPDCVIANDNCPGQLVISGKRMAVDNVCSLAKQHGAKRCIMLPVSAPFHSPLMAPALPVMQDVFDSSLFHPLRSRVGSNITTQDFSDETIKPLLLEQLTGKIRWREQVLSWKNDISTIIEVGPGRVLSNLNQRIQHEYDCKSLSNDIDKTIKMLLNN